MPNLQLRSGRVWPSTQNNKSLLGAYHQSYVSILSQLSSLDIPVQCCDSLQQIILLFGQHWSVVLPETYL